MASRLNVQSDRRLEIGLNLVEEQDLTFKVDSDMRKGEMEEKGEREERFYRK